VKPHTQNFCFGENPGKMCESLRKIAACALISQKLHPKSKRRPFLRLMFFFSSFRQVR